MKDEKEFLSAEEMAAMIGIELSMFRRLISKGTIPQGSELEGGKIRKWTRSRDLPGIIWLLDVQKRIKKQTPDEEEADAAGD